MMIVILDNVLCSFSYFCRTDVSPARLNLLQELLLIRNDVLECNTDNFLEEHEIEFFVSVLYMHQLN